MILPRVLSFRYNCHITAVPSLSPGRLCVGVKTPLTPDDETIQLYSGWQCIEERKFDENGEGTQDDAWEPRRQYMYGGQYIDDIVIFDKGTDDGACETRHFYCANINYNVHTLTDSDGAPMEPYLYDAYGAVEFLDGDGDPAVRSADGTFQRQLLFPVNDN